MKKIISTSLLALVLSIAIQPIKKAEAGLVILGAGIAISDRIENEQWSSLARLSGILVGVPVLLIGSVGSLPLLVLNDSSTSNDQVIATLAIKFPEISDLSLIQELGEEIIANYEMMDSKDAVEVKLDSELTRSILDRSDLSKSQVDHIINGLK